MKTNSAPYLITIIVCIVLGVHACQTYYFRSNYKDANKLLHETHNLKTKPFLKTHLKNGDVVILTDSWNIDTTLNMVSGKGIKYDYNRTVKFQGPVTFPIDSVSIFETNKKLVKPEEARINSLTLLAGLNVMITGLCITNPKACFGSCPTFYLNEQENFHFADAEGFSNAILPSMEYHDIDALTHKHLSDSTFSITMKNEALETHCIKNVKLLAYPLKLGERVYQSPTDEFYLCQSNYKVSRAKADEGDITGLLKDMDKLERFSLANEDNLKKSEDIFLEFESVDTSGGLGVIISFRQTLMTTYFIYSAMGYMGDEVADVFAEMENNSDLKHKLEGGIKKELGNIDIYIWDERKCDWEFTNSLYETGPISINKLIVPLKTINTSSNKVKLKLTLNKGLWRIDYVSLVKINGRVNPIEISPASIHNKGKLDVIALREIKSADKYLISMPGSEYKFNFNIPFRNAECELFIYSQGYYLEWMRDSWIKDKNLLKLKQMVDNPKKYLRDEAMNYKQYEVTSELVFWNSRIDTKAF